MPKFGTSGLRGLATDLTDTLCATYAEAFVSGTTHNGHILVGRDLRASSPRIRDAVAAGVARAGARPVDCGLLPTPALSLEATRMGTAAIMVTGSHIPANRNGLKFYTATGEITKADEARITAAQAALSADRPAIGASSEADSGALERFVTRYTGFFPADALNGLRVGVYQHSSVARDLLVTLLDRLGATPVPFGRSAEFVPVDTEAVDADTRAMLAETAQTHSLSAIVSTDGDADRPMLTDASGRVVAGDILGPITARYLGADSVATPVSSNTVVDRMQQFGSVARCRIGSPYVIETMETLQSGGHTTVVGYEANGGFLLGFRATRAGRSIEPLLTRDFALPILSVLAESKLNGGDVRDLTSALPSRHTATDRLTDVPQEASDRIVADLLSGDCSVLPEAAGQVISIDQTDGARMTLDGGSILHIRPSGNAPELRCYVESDSPEAAAALLADALTRLAGLAGNPR